MSVAAAAGHALKKSVLELGGSDPFIVLPSADLDACVRTAVTARVQNNGQSCIAAKRFIVVDEVADEFLARFTEAMDALVVGDPFDPATDVGPIVTEAQRDELVGQVDEARAPGRDGPRRRQGARRRRLVLRARPCSRASTMDMPVAQGGDLRAGGHGPARARPRRRDRGGQRHHLRAGLERVDERRGRRSTRCIEGIEAGAVFVNAMVASTPELPFGGIKRSGYGRELSELGLKEFANAKTVWIA